MHLIKEDLNGFPLLMQFVERIGVDDFIQWHHSQKQKLDDRLLKTGAILLRGIAIDSVEAFSTIMKALTVTNTVFRDRNSPRAKFASKVYNASEYDSDHKITMHTEYSYTAQWPSKLYFCCLKPALSGGETTVADGRRMLRVLRPALVEEFEKKQIRYVRNLHGGNGIGPSWQNSFETDDPSVLERYCEDNSIQYSWKGNGAVKLVQTRPAVRNHPVTGEKLWFNQVDQFYPLSYGEAMYETLLMMHNNDVEALPMYVTYGDGSPIKKQVIDEILDALDSEIQLTPWQKGDLLVIDNMLTLHGRMPFKGERVVLVSLS